MIEKGHCVHMNEILTALYARKSVRTYTKEPVSPEKKELILKAACAAPTAGNQQLYTMSFCTLHREARSNAVALCGLHHGALDTYLGDNPHLRHVVLYLDADGPYKGVILAAPQGAVKRSADRIFLQKAPQSGAVLFALISRFKTA